MLDETSLKTHNPHQIEKHILEGECECLRKQETESYRDGRLPIHYEIYQSNLYS